jgi:hypothetical protein
VPSSQRTSVKIEGYERVVAALRARAAKATGRPKVLVVYNAPYATVVHETNRHYASGQWKFLEQPARTLRRELGGIARETMKAGGTILDAELAAANRLLEASQELVPVRTGRLKRSGHVTVE